MKEKHRMKTVSLILCLIGCAALAAPFKFNYWNVVNSSTASPAQITNGTFTVKSITLFGFKSPQTSNTSTVYVGITSGNGEQPWPVYPGQSLVLRPVTGQDTQQPSNYWFDVTTANDGLIVTYE